MHLCPSNMRRAHALSSYIFEFCFAAVRGGTVPHMLTGAPAPAQLMLLVSARLVTATSRAQANGTDDKCMLCTWR